MVAKQRSSALGVKPTVQLKNDATHCKIYANPTLEEETPDLSLFEERVGLSWTYSGAFDGEESVLTDADKDLPVTWSKSTVKELNTNTECLVYGSKPKNHEKTLDCSSVDVRESNSPSGRVRDEDVRDSSSTTSISTTKSKRSVISKLRKKLKGRGTSKTSRSSGDGDSISTKDGHTSTSGSKAYDSTGCSAGNNLASALRLTDSYSIDGDANEGDLLICATREYTPQDWSNEVPDDKQQVSLDKDTGGCSAGTNLVSALRLTDSYSIDGDANEGDLLICATREYIPQDWSDEASDEKQVSLDIDGEANERDVASESEYIPHDWSDEVSDDKQVSLDEVNGGCSASTNLASVLRLTDSYSIDGDANEGGLVSGSEYSPQDWSIEVSDEKQVSLGEDGVKDEEHEEKEETKVDTDRSFFRFW